MPHQAAPRLTCSQRAPLFLLLQVAESLLCLVDQAPLEGEDAGTEPALLALLRALREKGLWQLARAVVRGAAGHGVPPSLAAANEVIAACAAQGVATEVRALLACACAGEEGMGGALGVHAWLYFVCITVQLGRSHLSSMCCCRPRRCLTGW